MTRYESLRLVDGGYYWNTASWSLHAVDGAQGVLPGAEGTKWLKLPLPAMVVAALVVSIAFLIFLPFIGFALVAWTAVAALGRALEYGAARLAHVVAPHWQPGEAWLARHEARKPAEKTPEALEALRQDVDARRAEEEEQRHGKR